MTVRAATIERAPLVRPYETPLVAAAGLAILLGRSTLLAAGPLRAPTLIAAYLLLGVLSLGPILADERRAPTSPAMALAVGLGAVAVVAWARAPAVPHATGAVALTLTILAAVAEEAFFRRFLYGRLAAWPVAAIMVSSLLFAAIHIPVYGPPAFWLDFGAGLLLSWQRWASGSWGVPAATHSVANILVVLR